MSRTDLSRPLQMVIGDGLLGTGRSVMDYGCGRGGDVARLRAMGFACSGWDPVHAPEGERRRADVVNLGYVVNVIEDAQERRDVLRRAWDLAESLLVVAGRLVDEKPKKSLPELSDGVLTRIGTFQKFFEQQELRSWVDQTLGCRSVAAAPGIFYVFRSEEARSDFVARRFRRLERPPRLRLTDRLLAEHGQLLSELAQFLASRGRLPEDGEHPCHAELVAKLGSVARAHRLLLLASDSTDWDTVRQARSEDLLVFLALSKFDGRPAFGQLPLDMQRDVKAFFGTYAKASAAADELLFGLGDPRLLDEAAAGSPLGKLLPTALYIHVDAVSALPLRLRLYEGCARAVLGEVEDATIVKLRRDEPKISYLCYPRFERDAHPALVESVSVHLQTFRVKTRRYGDSANPPVLHRKETFVTSEHPSRGKFARLTQAEERAGLLDDTARIGLRSGWQEALAASNVEIRGHRLVKRNSEP